MREMWSECVCVCVCLAVQQQSVRRHGSTAAAIQECKGWDESAADAASECWQSDCTWTALDRPWQVCLLWYQPTYRLRRAFSKWPILCGVGLKISIIDSYFSVTVSHFSLELSLQSLIGLLQPWNRKTYNFKDDMHVNCRLWISLLFVSLIHFS